MLADGQVASILGTATLTISSSFGKHRVNVYVLNELSQPLILGTSYLVEHGIVLDFAKHRLAVTKSKVKVSKTLTLAPSSDTIIRVNLATKMSTGVTSIYAFLQSPV